jgi:hypothetical protein
MSTLKRTLAEVAEYPPHPPRTASALYERTHQQLVVTEDRPCAVCGVRRSTLGTANPYGAKALETHHDLIEWAGATEIDWDKLAADHPSLPNLVALAKAYHAHLDAHGTFEGTLDPAIVTQFVDSDEQMLVLCDVHHRSALQGIHMITGPVWQLQHYAAPGYHFVGPAAASVTMADDEPPTDPATDGQGERL